MPRKKATKEAIEIGKRIRGLREKERMTREQLAETIDVTVGYLADVERGDAGISCKTLMLLCKLLHTSADYILFGRQSCPSVGERSAMLPADLQEIIDDLVTAQIRLYMMMRDSCRKEYEQNVNRQIVT